MVLKARVSILPKKDILDPQGQAISGALKNMGFAMIENVRQGKIIEITLSTDDRDLAEKDIEIMCRQLLVNQVIESYEIAFLE